MKNSLVINLFLLVILTVIFIIYLPLFYNYQFFGGDFYFNAFPQIEDSWIGSILSWDSMRGGGLGGNSFVTMPFDTYSKILPPFLILWGLSLPLIQKIVFIFPLILLSFISSFRLFKKLFIEISEQSVYPLLSSLIYSSNTYILMIVYGGQFGIALAYSVIPILIENTHDLIIFKSLKHQNKLILRLLTQSLWLSLLVLFDLRITFIFLIVATLFLIYFWIINKLKLIDRIFSLIKTIIVPGLLSISIHAYWLLPVFLLNISPTASVGSVYTSTVATKYFSFADFSHAFSLLHPNWPENIFGKTYFQRPEFLVIPMIAFLSLIFISKSKYKIAKIQIKNKIFNTHQIPNISRHNILFFAILGLIGTFLAKGTNDPFGGVYLWLFEHVPGFVLFRDPTKFYLLIALSYSVLIPYSLFNISNFIWDKSLKDFNKLKICKDFLNLTICFSFILFWIFTFRPAIFATLGPLRALEVPVKYRNLASAISIDQNYYRTLWVPKYQRFGYISSINPAIDAMDISGESSISGVVNWLNKPETSKQLARWGVKYVIVPEDTMEEIYISDRKYDHKLYSDTVKSIDKISWLKKANIVTDLNIWATPEYNSRFWDESGTDVVINLKNPTKYIINLVDNNQPKKIIFSERFDTHWEAQTSQGFIRSIPTIDNLNSFNIPSSVDSAVIFYKPQKYVDLGIRFSLFTLITVFTLIIYFTYAEYKSKKVS